LKRLTLPLLALIPALYVAPLMASNLMVEGQVQTPGEYAWRDGLRLLDLTTSAGVSVNS
jgi:protein involved in polysaccharide export with SLBB domain